MEGRHHTMPGHPDAGGWDREAGGIMAQPHGYHQYTAQPPAMSLSPQTACMVKRLHAQAPRGSTLPTSVTPLSKTTFTHPPTLHRRHLLSTITNSGVGPCCAPHVPASRSPDTTCTESDSCGTLHWLSKRGGIPLTVVTAAEPPPCTQPQAHWPGGAGPTSLNPLAPCH